MNASDDGNYSLLDLPPFRNLQNALKTVLFTVHPQWSWVWTLSTQLHPTPTLQHFNWAGLPYIYFTLTLPECYHAILGLHLRRKETAEFTAHCHHLHNKYVAEATKNYQAQYSQIGSVEDC